MSKVIKSLPLHSQVYNILLEDIVSGQKKLGEKLLEIKIAQDLGVSRSPVREALRMLENEGFALNTQNGLIVYPLELEDVKELFECRTATEPFAAFLATQKLSSHVDKLLSLVDRAESLQKRGNFQAVADCNTELHMSIINACGNNRLIEMIEKFYSLIIVGRNADLIAFGPRDCLIEHRMIIQAIKEEDRNLVESLVRKHLENDWKYFYQGAKSKSGLL